jgi:histidine kinase/DNA gyrase B/HSP90-like ATPase
VPKHVKVSASFPADLPPVGVAAHGLTQAVLNLVVNAGEAIPEPNGVNRKGGKGKVRVAAEAAPAADGAWVRLSVADNGTGMPDDVKRRAFDMFFTTKTRGLGTGLGLALVRQVVERAGGRVDIDSKVGRGTTVTMSLPAVVPAESAEAERGDGGAVVSIGDGRAAALMRHLLEVSGTPVRLDGDAAGARVWIVDPATASIERVRAWRRDHPRSRLVLFGVPSSASAARWRALAPLTIEQRDDLEAVRHVIGRAVASREQPE